MCICRRRWADGSKAAGNGEEGMRTQITELRAAMAREGVDVYMVTMDDDHQSEYVGAHYREIAELSGFTGSAGTLVVTKDEAGLWTDGRYFVQAAAQLMDSGVKLMKMGEPDTPDIQDYIVAHTPEHGAFGFNGKCVSCTLGVQLGEKLELKHAVVHAKKDLAGEVWKNRPAPHYSTIFILDEKYAGESAQSKLSRLAEELGRMEAGAHVISTLDDIAWLLNLRADDIPNNPVFLAFFLIDGGEMRLYTAKEHLTDAVFKYLAGLGVDVVTDPDQIYPDLKKLRSQAVLLETGKTNFALVSSLPDHIRVIDRILPTTVMKCKKNPVECENLKRAHLKDGVALTKFMYWFRTHVGREPMTEWSAAEKLHEFRAQNEGFLDESFTTISAYGPNAAMCHYAPSSEQSAEILPKGLYLVDSGGQYYEGTTDVTRTWACGPTTKEERCSFTLSVIANLRLADARFLEGTNGVALDYIAREPFWTRGLNYNHGTGHGVGYLLNVHERPVGIRYRIVPERQDAWPFSEGMFVSDEPGLYIEGSHGVRTENMLMCVNDYRNEYGQFCRFETYTLCPLDREALEPELMTVRDKELYNAYQQKVYDALSPYMSEEERCWLSELCRSLEPDAVNA